MNVLNTQAGICLIEADGSAVCARSEIDKFLKIFAARRRWRALCKFEEKIEDGSDIFGEIGDVFVERAVVDGEETDLIVFEFDELGEVGSADFVEILGGAAAARAKDQFDFDVGEFGFHGQDDEEGME